LWSGATAGWCLDVRAINRPVVTTKMRFIHLYLIGYFILVVGVGLALWQAGVFNRVAPIWLVIGVIVAVGLGIMLAVSSGKPTVTEALQK
jgi:hypothetical protein